VESMRWRELLLCEQSVELPSLDIFRKFIYGISFYQGQVPTDRINDINEAMVKVFEEQCNREHEGKLIFNIRFYVARGEK